VPSREPIDEAPPTPLGVVARARVWAAGNPRRSLAIGLGFCLSIGAMLAAWILLADLAAAPPLVTIEMALEALDAGDDELAESLVEQIQEQAAIQPGAYGGPLFVLGAIKSRQAALQWAPERKRTEFFIASKYLSEARLIGWPKDREFQGLYLLGKSLIESRQLKRGVETLESALEIGTAADVEVHLLLAEAFYYGTTPKYDDALAQLDLAIDHPTISEKQRGGALLLRAQSLAKLRRWDEAEESVDRAGVDGAVEPAERFLTLGKVLVGRVEGSTEQGAKPESALISRAEDALRRAQSLDKLSTPVTREADYLLAQLRRIQGDAAGALAGFIELRRNHGQHSAGIAAALSEADLLRLSGDTDDALEAYRRALESLVDPSEYRSGVLPLVDLRRRLRAAHDGFLADGQSSANYNVHYSAAYRLAQQVSPVMSTVTQLRLQATTLAAWGNRLLDSGDGVGSDNARLRSLGRERLREAGLTYEQLAQARFAYREYTDILWNAADAYYIGQSYSSALRVLQRYLKHEPVQRNARVLLRLGQSSMALGAVEQAIEAYEECLEFHPVDTSSDLARLECAMAQRSVGNAKRAEELLRTNLRSPALTPESPEWRESLFELGGLLLSGGRHEEGLNALDEAVARYPEAAAAPMARYRMAEAHRFLAQEPLASLEAAKTLNERERSRAAAYAHLEAALALYGEVRDGVLLANTGDRRDRVLLRNCYMLGGATLFELGRYEEAIREYSDVSTLYQNEPFVLEPLVRISHCWRRRKDPVRAAGAIQQAKGLLSRLPSDADFATSTPLTRAEWVQLLDELERVHRGGSNGGGPIARDASLRTTQASR
jgi:tetratricopeptide (TPR) repeat protein